MYMHGAHEKWQVDFPLEQETIQVHLHNRQ